MNHELPVSISAHQPERQRRSVIVAQGGCCCTCCCCCLHTLAALGGAIWAIETPRFESVAEDPPRPDAAKRFWLMLALSVWVGGPVLFWQLGSEYNDRALARLLATGVIGFVLFPIAQLAAILLTLLWIVIQSRDRKSQLRSLASIALWSFVGFCCGAFSMLVIARLGGWF